MAVRYVVAPNRVAPDGWTRRPLPGWLTQALGTQVDLRHITSDPSLLVYENTAWAPGRAQLPDDASTEPADATTTDLAGAKPVLPDEPATAQWRGRVGGGRVLLSEASSRRWQLRVGGRTAPRDRAFGWANVFNTDRSGEGDLSYRTPLSSRVLLLLEILLWVVAIRFAIRHRRRRERSEP
jgi:hypothetical protein